MRLFSLFAAAAVSATVALTGCNSTETKTAEVSSVPTKVAEAPSEMTIFESHDDGRIHQFYDQNTFDSYKSVGETAYRLTRIGAGPNGETVVFGLPKVEKRKGLTHRPQCFGMVSLK